MRNSNVKSKPFAVPQYPSARGYPTQTLMTLQARRATGTAALIGLSLAVLLVVGVTYLSA